MDQHGSRDWLRPLLDQLGPFVQLQLSDLADLLEIVDNFYHMRSPSATIATLILLFGISIFVMLVPTETSLRAFWLLVGVVFFACWPVSSLYPCYRLVVSPARWAFWKVPTHAEWSIKYLQERASRVRMALSDPSETSPTPASSHDPPASTTSSGSTFNPDTDLLSFSCTYHRQPGHLILDADTLRFAPASMLETLQGHISAISPVKPFHYEYKDLVEMRKDSDDGSKTRTRKGSASHALLAPLKKVTAATGLTNLELKFMPRKTTDEGVSTTLEPDIILLEYMHSRNRAFNAILAFSRVQWRHVPLRSIKHPVGV